MELVELRILLAIEKDVTVESVINEVVREIKTIPNYVSDIHYISRIGQLKIIHEPRYDPISDTNIEDAWNLADEYKIKIDKSEGVEYYDERY
jgi:hypothetical protein